jgi:hypothetical protein
VLGAVLSIAGAALALWLVREDEIEREPAEAEPAEAEPEHRREPEAVPEAAAA